MPHADIQSAGPPELVPVRPLSERPDLLVGRTGGALSHHPPATPYRR